MACPLSEGCHLFAAGSPLTPQTAAMFQSKYCRGENAECARYLVYVALGRTSVPTDLFPNDRLRALRLVRPNHYQR